MLFLLFRPRRYAAEPNGWIIAGVLLLATSVFSANCKGVVARMIESATTTINNVPTCSIATTKKGDSQGMNATTGSNEKDEGTELEDGPITTSFRTTSGSKPTTSYQVQASSHGAATILHHQKPAPSTAVIDGNHSQRGVASNDRAYDGMDDDQYHHDDHHEVDALSGNHDDFWDYFDCDVIMSEERPIHNSSIWTMLRESYVMIVGAERASLDLTNNTAAQSGFQVKVQVTRFPGGKGRGVIAKENIPEGTVVWEAIHTARFPSAIEFRRYLLSIPGDLACDVLIWAYVEEYAFEDQEEPIPTISVDLDEGSFVNSVDVLAEDGLTGEKNVDDDTYKTTRFVHKGEELVVDYRDFEDLNDWEVLGFALPLEDLQQPQRGFFENFGGSRESF